MNNDITSKEIVQYFKMLLRRAHVNLENAEARNDHRASANIKRKISIYAWVITKIQN